MLKVKKVGLALLGALRYYSFLSGASESSTMQMLVRAIE